jgi:3-hydroxyisobutyrate dehydrogenase-like beta-hydroxyacid dehydrogenase
MARPSIALLGLGKMGYAMALRLREHGHAVSVWNRSPAKALELQALSLPGACVVSETAAAAVSATAADSAVLLVLSDAAACMETIHSLGDAVRGRTIVNLTSGSPDDGRQVASALAAPALGVRAYVDGAYCGPPAKVRQGAGVLFVSSSNAAEVSRLAPALGLLGEVAFAGPVGASRALDYAVVDLVLVAYNSLFANVEMLQRERVTPAQLHEHVAKRLATLPAALEALHGRCSAERSDAAYTTQQVQHHMVSRTRAAERPRQSACAQCSSQA